MQRIVRHSSCLVNHKNPTGNGGVSCYGGALRNCAKARGFSRPSRATAFSVLGRSDGVPSGTGSRHPPFSNSLGWRRGRVNGVVPLGGPSGMRNGRNDLFTGRAKFHHGREQGPVACQVAIRPSYRFPRCVITQGRHHEAVARTERSVGRIVTVSHRPRTDDGHAVGVPGYGVR